MKFLLYTLLLLGGLNLISARSIYWGPYHTHIISPSYYDYNDEIFAVPSRDNSDEGKDSELISDLLGKSSEDSKEPKILNTSDERDESDDIETLGDKTIKEFESFLSTMLGDDASEEKTETVDESKETTDEKDDSKEDNDNDNDTDNSKEQKPLKDEKSSEEKKSYDVDLNLDDSSEESYATLVFKKNDDDDDDVDVHETTKTSEEKVDEISEEISEKDIRELTAILMTLSTMDDLIKIAENTSEDEELLNGDLNEKKLKEVNNYLSFFGTVLDKILDESSEVDKDTEKSKKDDDNDSKDKETNNDKDDKDDSKSDDDDDDDNDDDQQDNKPKDHDEDVNVSLEFHGLENSKTNLDNHRYNIFQRSTPTVEFKPTSSPYLPETLSSNVDNNNVIQEYVEVREKLDALQDNLVLNKLNMDKNFYNIIANESDDKNMKNFENDIAILRENAYKIKQSVNDIQDIKSKLYFHKLIKAALKGAQLN